MQNIDDSLEPLAGTVVYSGVRGTTPTKRIPIISEAFPPNGCHLAYTVLGYDRQGRSTSVIMDCEHARMWAESAEAELRRNPLKRFFRPEPQSVADIGIDNVVRQMSPLQRLFPPAHLGKDILAETIIIGMLDASREDQTPRLDAQVVSYSDYKPFPLFKMSKDHSGGPDREAPEAAFANQNSDVLIACGSAWDVGYAAELLPEEPLQRHVGHLRNSLPYLGDKHEDLPTLVKRFPHTVAHNAAQSLVRATHNEIGYKEAAMEVNYQTLRDVRAYRRIIERGPLASFMKTGTALVESMAVLDELRPHLRRVGIFDTETMEQHTGAISRVIETVLTTPQNARSEVLALRAQAVARSVFGPQESSKKGVDAVVVSPWVAALDAAQAKSRIEEQENERPSGDLALVSVVLEDEHARLVYHDLFSRTPLRRKEMERTLTDLRDTPIGGRFEFSVEVLHAVYSIVDLNAYISSDDHSRRAEAIRTLQRLDEGSTRSR